jgi:hypothetical protein
MFGWWSEDYLIQNLKTPIYIYTTENGYDSMVIAITESADLEPDNLHRWKCVGRIYNRVNTINFNNLIGKKIDTFISDECSQQNKRQKLSQDEISFTDKINFVSGKNYGWYSQEFANTKNNFVSDRNNNQVPVPKVHKYLTPSNSTVLVTHITSNPNSKPFPRDAFFVGEVTKYLESVSFF